MWLKKLSSRNYKVHGFAHYENSDLNICIFSIYGSYLSFFSCFIIAVCYLQHMVAPLQKRSDLKESAKFFWKRRYSSLFSPSLFLFATCAQTEVTQRGCCKQLPNHAETIPIVESQDEITLSRQVVRNHSFSLWSLFLNSAKCLPASLALSRDPVSKSRPSGDER